MVEVKAETNESKNMIYSITSRLLITLALGSVFAASAAENDNERDPREFNYLQLSGGLALPSSSNIQVGLGSGVRLPGHIDYNRGSFWSATLGRQFLRNEDEQEKRKRQQTDAATATDSKVEERRPWRVELELWNANAVRNTIEIGASVLHPHEKVKPSVLFLNMAMPIFQSEELYVPEDLKRTPEPLWRTWLGAGVGYANLTYASSSHLSGCNCLREASANALAYQLKLQFERQVDENTYLFAQFGRAWLPSVSTVQGGQNTEYGRWSFNDLAIGIRWMLRD